MIDSLNAQVIKKVSGAVGGPGSGPSLGGAGGGMGGMIARQSSNGSQGIW